jgi:hypothetical protein
MTAGLTAVPYRGPSTATGTRGVFLRGAAFACICGVVAISGRVIAPGSALLGLLCVVILPLLLAAQLTRQRLAAIGLLWMNELFFGFDGRWVEFGPISGRGLILLVLLLSSMSIGLGSRRQLAPSRSTERAIVFYGLVLPSILFYYSAFFRETPIAAAFGDSVRYLALLAYFPFRRVLQTHFDAVFGWFVGGIVAVSMILLFASVGPQPLATAVYFAYSGATTIATLESGISRTASPILILTLAGIFLGALYAADAGEPRARRGLGVLLAAIAAAPLVVSFMRGPLLASAATGLLVLAAAPRGFGHRGALVRTGLILGSVGLAAFVSMVVFVPEGYEYFRLGDRTVVEYFADAQRSEQASRMLEAFSENPVLGKGVGVPLADYQRGQDTDTLSAELHFHVLLYRAGGVAFVLFMLPIIWFFFELFRLRGPEGPLLAGPQGKCAMATLAALLTTFISGATNPYLLTAFTMFLIVMYLSTRDGWWGMAGASDTTVPVGASPVTRQKWALVGRD